MLNKEQTDLIEEVKKIIAYNSELRQEMLLYIESLISLEKKYKDDIDPAWEEIKTPVLHISLMYWTCELACWYESEWGLPARIAAALARAGIQPAHALRLTKRQFVKYQGLWERSYEVFAEKRKLWAMKQLEIMRAQRRKT